MLTIQMAKIILQAASSWKMSRRKVFTFSHTTVEKSKIEHTLVSVINEPNLSVLYNECSPSVLKRNVWVSLFPKSIYKALQYLI